MCKKRKHQKENKALKSLIKKKRQVVPVKSDKGNVVIIDKPKTINKQKVEKILDDQDISNIIKNQIQT